MSNANAEFFEALKLLEKEKGIPADYLMEKIRAHLDDGTFEDFYRENVGRLDRRI